MPVRKPHTQVDLNNGDLPAAPMSPSKGECQIARYYVHVLSSKQLMSPVARQKGIQTNHLHHQDQNFNLNHSPHLLHLHILAKRWEHLPIKT